MAIQLTQDVTVDVICEVSDQRSIALSTLDPRLRNHGDDDPEPSYRHDVLSNRYVFRVLWLNTMQTTIVSECEITEF